MGDSSNGKVYLVGAGPGNPDLITLKGLECLKKADVVIYDYLANKELLSWVKDSTEIIYVGKKAGEHTLTQEQINQLLVNKAKKGKTVIRLKGGDPFIFGRGGEEAEFLVDEGIEIEVVPGVTSAIAVPAYAGIPLTHRKYTSTLTIFTGHESAGITEKEPFLPWQEIAKIGGTIVILMGVSNLASITNELISHGLSKQTPIAIICWGTTKEQKTIIGTLDNILEKSAGIKPPGIIVIGDVVNLRKKLNWFEKKCCEQEVCSKMLPLLGKMVLVTRAMAQASELSLLLKEYGASVVEFPLIKVISPTSFEPLDKAIEKINLYEWIIFTSINGVQSFFKRLKQQGKDLRELKGVQIGAIGPKTGQAIKDIGLNIDIQPEDEYLSEGLVKLLSCQRIKGKRVLIPRAQEAREILVDELKRLGAEVDVVPAYQTITETFRTEELYNILKGIDIITFTSSSTVINFVSKLKSEDMNNLLSGIKIASIGPITTQKAEELGLKVDITASEYTINGLVNAILYCEK